MKTLTESLNKQINEKVELGEINIPWSSTMKKGFMCYNLQTSTVSVIQFNSPKDLEKEYNTDEVAFEDWVKLDKMKVAEVLDQEIPDLVCTRIW